MSDRDDTRHTHKTTKQTGRRSKQSPIDSMHIWSVSQIQARAAKGMHTHTAHVYLVYQQTPMILNGKAQSCGRQGRCNCVMMHPLKEHTGAYRGADAAVSRPE